MKMTELMLEELEREAELTERALEQVPEGKNNWKPHPKSMDMGQLAHLIATMPSWISAIVNQNELDIKPKDGGTNGKQRQINSTAELIQAHSKAVAEARKALTSTNEAHLKTPWKLLEGGKVAQENSRYGFIMDNFGHLAHHRGQLTVYLRMNEAQVPAIYGPSADEHRF
jgi:uncharacterized damage-inducible protein DinB